MAGFWGKRKREEQDAADADLARRAELAIVAADERVRLTSDELDFARAELGDKATEDLGAALDSVRTHLAEAFQLHQLNHDEIPDTKEELRTRNARIIQLSEWAEDLLEERTQVLQPKIDAVRRAPETLARVRADRDRLAERIPNAACTATCGAMISRPPASKPCCSVRASSRNWSKMSLWAIRSRPANRA